MPLGHKHSLETREKMRRTHLKLGTKPPSWSGKKHTKEWKEKMSRKMTGRKAPWNIIKNKNPLFWTPEVRKKASESGEKRPLNLKALSITHQKNVGKKRTLEQRMKISIALRGDKSSAWRGGITPEHKRLRSSAQLIQWRKDVFKRDKHVCQKCGQKGGYLQAHHIKPFAYFSELRFELSNGVTLCLKCHRETDSFGHKAHKHDKKGS